MWLCWDRNPQRSDYKSAVLPTELASQSVICISFYAYEWDQCWMWTPVGSKTNFENNINSLLKDDKYTNSLVLPLREFTYKPAVLPTELASQ